MERCFSRLGNRLGLVKIVIEGPKTLKMNSYNHYRHMEEKNGCLTIAMGKQGGRKFSSLGGKLPLRPPRLIPVQVEFLYTADVVFI